MNKLYCILFICVVQPTIYIHGLGLLPNDKVIIDVYDYKTCPEEKDLPIQLSDIDIVKDPETDVMYVSGTLVNKIPIDEMLKSFITISKCTTEADESCSKYVTYEFDNLCDILWKKDNQAYEFTSRTKGLGTKCPIEPGSYFMEVAPINSTGMFPPTGAMEGHWRSRYTAKVEDKVVSCIVIAAELKLKRGGS